MLFFLEDLLEGLEDYAFFGGLVAEDGVGFTGVCLAVGEEGHVVAFEEFGFYLFFYGIFVDLLVVFFFEDC